MAARSVETNVYGKCFHTVSDGSSTFMKIVYILSPCCPLFLCCLVFGGKRMTTKQNGDIIFLSDRISNAVDSLVQVLS